MDREDPESRIRYLASLSWLSGYVASSSTTCRVKKWYMKYEIWQWDWWTFPPNHPSPKTMKKKGKKTMSTRPKAGPVSLQNLTIYCLRSLYSNRDAVWRSDWNMVSGFSHPECTQKGGGKAASWVRKRRWFWYGSEASTLSKQCSLTIIQEDRNNSSGPKDIILFWTSQNRGNFSREQLSYIVYAWFPWGFLVPP